MRHTAFRERLTRREPLLGLLLSLPSPELAEILVGGGCDWLFIDMEHGLLDQTDVQRAVQAVGAACPCIVRVPNHEPTTIAKVLDTGADGIIAPHVNSAEQARRVVSAAKYPPAGTRSLGAGRASGYGVRPTGSVVGDNAETLVIAQVEHIDAVGCIDEIVRVPGVDAVFIGPFDLSASMGKPGEIGAPDVAQAIGRVVEACVARGLPSGLFVVDGAAAGRATGAGHSLVCLGTDSLLIAAAARRLVAEAREAGAGAGVRG